jgi:hypothetical protein
MSGPDRSDKPWVVRDVPEDTRRQVKAYAAMHGLTMAQAIENLITAGQRPPLPTMRPQLSAGEQKRVMDSILEGGKNIIAAAWLQHFETIDATIVAQVRAYALKRDCTMSEALEELVTYAMTTYEVKYILKSAPEQQRKPAPEQQRKIGISNKR